MSSAREIQKLSESLQSASYDELENKDDDSSSDDEGITQFFLSANNKFTTKANIQGGSVKHLYDELENESVDEITIRLFNQEREETQYPCGIKSPDLTNKMFAILVDWLTEVAIKYKLQFKTFCLTIYLMKYCLADNDFSNLAKDKLQLLGITCAFIAAKVEEMYSPQISDWIYISDRAYNKQQILEMEQRVLVTTQFRMFVTPDDFITLFGRIIGPVGKRNLMVKYILEASMKNFKLLCTWLPSELTSGATYLAAISIGNDDNTVQPVVDAWNSNLTRTELDTAKEVAQDMYDAITSEKTLKATMRKYATGTYLNVSRINLINPNYEK